MNNQKLEEMKQYSCSQHSSSRHSEHTIGNKNFSKTGFPNQPRFTRAHNFLQGGGSSGFAGNSLGPARLPESRTSLIDDLESLITIAENTELPSAFPEVEELCN